MNEAHAPAYDTSEYLASGAQIAHTGVMGYMRLRWVSMPESCVPGELVAGAAASPRVGNTVQVWDNTRALAPEGAGPE